MHMHSTEDIHFCDAIFKLLKNICDAVFKCLHAKGANAEI